MSDSAKPRITSGSKFRNEHGFSAIKDGIKRSSGETSESKPVERKPKWLRAKMPGGERYEAVRKNVSDHRLSTVCQESHCPNIGECWAAGTATIMAGVAAAREHSVYLGSAPAVVPLPLSFRSLSQQIKAASGALPIGITHPEP